MRKRIVSFLVLLLLGLAGLAAATYVGDLLRAGIDVTGNEVALNKDLQFNTATVTAAGPTDNLDVEDVNVVFIDTSSNGVTLGGTVNGASGQVLHVVITDSTNNATIEHAEATGNQDFYTFDGSDEATNTSYGGWTFVCNSTHWYEVQDD